jgi:hypothetical protein
MNILMKEKLTKVTDFWLFEKKNQLKVNCSIRNPHYISPKSISEEQ